ncbi:ParA family protein [Pectinatus frisingensis]
MKTIGFINWKGGVGKTSISTNMAYALSEGWDAKILFVDNDKQGNASSWFNADCEHTLTDILLNNATAKEIIQKTRYANIDLIAADADLLDANFTVLKNQTKRQDNILKNALEEVKNEYDICIIDNPPDSNITVLNAMEAADDIIAVSTIDRYSLNGIYQLQNEIDNYNELLGLKIAVKGVLLNRFTSTVQSYAAIDKLETSGFHVFDTHIREVRSTKNQLEIAINSGKSIYETVPNCAFARDLIKFIEKLIG